MMADWKIDIATPNGNSGQLVIADSEDLNEISAQIAAFISTAKEHDEPPLETGEAGIPASIQPRRDATIGKA